MAESHSTRCSSQWSYPEEQILHYFAEEKSRLVLWGKQTNQPTLDLIAFLSPLILMQFRGGKEGKKKKHTTWNVVIYPSKIPISSPTLTEMLKCFPELCWGYLQRLQRDPSISVPTKHKVNMYSTRVEGKKRMKHFKEKY